MHDLTGRLIGPGDQIAYAVRRGSSTEMTVGDVIAINGKKITVDRQYTSGHGRIGSTVTLSATNRVVITRKGAIPL